MDAKAWLSAYGSAWERKDTADFIRLFSPGGRYHWTPFETPREGRSQLAEAFESAIERQEDIHFEFEILSKKDRESVAHWRCDFRRMERDYRVHLDGIFRMEFDDQGQCTVFREWWHSDEDV
jgi:hypothetical protein